MTALFGAGMCIRPWYWVPRMCTFARYGGGGVPFRELASVFLIIVAWVTVSRIHIFAVLATGTIPVDGKYMGVSACLGVSGVHGTVVA